MNNFAENVVEFNRSVLQIEGRDKSLMVKDELNHLEKCLSEEIGELISAHEDQDYIAAVDSLIDLMYFAIGGLHKMGLTPEEMAKCGEVVHFCNMQKKKGTVERRGDGSVPDATKPETWVGPELMIAEILGGRL